MMRPFKVLGVSRVADNEKSFLVSLSANPSDDELKAFHDYLDGWIEHCYRNKLYPMGDA